MSDKKSLTNLVKFVIGGVINTAFTFFLYLSLQIVLPYQVAYAVAFAVGIVFSYWFNAIIVFKTHISWKGFFAFPLVYLVQYLISAMLLGFFVERVGVPQRFAPLIVIALTIPITFVLTRWYLRRS